MSQQPPPPPYGGPPGSYPPGNFPPGNYPPGPYPQGPQEPPPGGMSNKAKFWIGVLLSLPALFVAGVVTGGGSWVADGLGADPQVGAIISSVLGLLLFVGFVFMVVIEKTRWFAIGMVAGGAILLILLAGACVVLLVALTSSYN